MPNDWEATAVPADSGLDEPVSISLVSQDRRPLVTGVKLINHAVVLRRSTAENELKDEDFHEALALILGRLRQERIHPLITLDASSLPPSQRKGWMPDDHQLKPPFGLKGTPRDYANRLVQASQGLERDHRPFMRLRFPWVPHYALASILDGTIERRPHGLSASQLRQVEAQHIRIAIDELQEHARLNRFRDATGYWLLPPDGGEPLPPKKVFGIALAEALRTHTTPNDFSSGPLIFGIMKERGFEVVSQRELEARTSTRTRSGGANAPKSEVPLTEEERRWIEGNPKFVAHMRNERSGAAPTVFKNDFREKYGRLFCERCDNDFIGDYGAMLAEGCFEVHHTIPVSRMKPNHVTTPEQLQLLCANCHRITHWEMAGR